MIETHERSLVARALLALLSGYRAWVSPQLGLACRFVPTCSQYAAQAIESHGTLRGVALSLLRLSRCHPLGGSGLDPVPSRGER